MWKVQVNAEVLELPTCFAEMPTDMYQRIKSIDKEEPTLLDVFGAMVGIKYTELAKTRSEQLLVDLYQVCSFIFNSPERFRYEPAPECLLISDKVIKLPTNLESLTLEQNIYLRSRMDDAKFMEQLISIACAVYLQPLVDGTDFNLDRAKELEKEICKLPIVYTFPVGFFFLSQIKSSGNFGWLYLLLQELRSRLWRRSLPRWQTLKT